MNLFFWPTLVIFTNLKLNFYQFFWPLPRSKIFPKQYNTENFCNMFVLGFFTFLVNDSSSCSDTWAIVRAGVPLWPGSLNAAGQAVDGAGLDLRGQLQAGLLQTEGYVWFRSSFHALQPFGKKDNLKHRTQNNYVKKLINKITLQLLIGQNYNKYIRSN